MIEERYPDGLPYPLQPYRDINEHHSSLITPDMIVVQAQDDAKIKEKTNFFVCPVCVNVVIDPKECSGCQSLFCKKCIEPWLERGNNHCPKKCKGNEEVEFKEVHRFVMNELHELLFKCQNHGCGQQNTYQAAISHFKRCEQLMQPCRLGCGMGVLGKDMDYHCTKQCENFQLTCDKCDEAYKPREQEQHDCVSTLKAKLAEARLRITELEKHPAGRGRAGQSQPAAARDESLSGLQCHLGHQLHDHSGHVEGYNGNPRCDQCYQTNLEEFEFFFRCDECDHDICLACSLLNQGVLNLEEQMITDHGCALKVITNDNRGERICDGEGCGKSSYGT